MCNALSSRFCGVELATRTTASPSTTPGALLPPLEAPALPPREAYQGILGYENHPMYVYLARSQARNWPYSASRCGRPRRTTGHPWACTSSEIVKAARA